MTDETADGHPLVSVVIVHFNGTSLLRNCLVSVFGQSYARIEVIVVDNGSTDGSAVMLRDEFPMAVILTNPRNLGFAEANNQGVRAASGDVVVLLNNDTVVEPGWIEGLRGTLADPGVAVVTSKVVTEGVPARFYEMNGTINFLGYNIMRHFADTSQVFFGGGASLAFRKQVVGEPFPTEYFLYHEDVFLSWRMRLLGYDVRMAQDSVVRHVGSASTRRQPSALVTFYQERNRLLNTLLLFGSRTLLVLLPFLVADAIAKTAVSLLGNGKSFRGIARAYGWVLSHPVWILRRRRMLQARRVIADSRILALMSPKVLEDGGRFSRWANRFSAWYAGATGLLQHD